MICSYCGGKIPNDAAFCPSCGARVTRDTLYQEEERKREQEQREKEYQNKTAIKSRYVAAILALLIGGLGAHKFYCGHYGTGIVYILFAWTGIPYLLAIINMVMYIACTSDEEFVRKYCKE